MRLAERYVANARSKPLLPSVQSLLGAVDRAGHILR